MYDEPDEKELEKRRVARRVEQASNPHYIKDDRSSRRKKLKDMAADKENYDNIPVAKIDLSVPLHVPGNYNIVLLCDTLCDDGNYPV